MVWGLVLLVKCGAPVGIIRGYAAHPVGVAVALLWRCLALGARLELGVRTYSPDDANKKSQLMVWGLVLLVKCGAPVGIIRGYAAYPVGVAVALLWRCLALGARAFEPILQMMQIKNPSLKAGV